jgi:riboflavin kinase/FMN adenylyltransferase
MDIIKGLDFHIKNSAVSLGKFDGIHRGHRLLLEHILAEETLHPTVFTFQGILSGSRIYSEKEQSALLAQIGMEREILFPFCEETKSMLPEQFIREILQQKMDAKLICVGEDFRFGKGRQGDVSLLSRLSGECGYRLVVLPKMKWQDEVISSTRIRKNLQEGRLDEANALLGEDYFVLGEVVHGNALGRTVGMPTANIVPPQDKLLPCFGVYATTIKVDENCYKGVTNVGVKPTVGADRPTVETTLFDFEGDLYGKEIQVTFRDFLRTEKKFDTLQQLQEQMKRDRQQAATLLSAY